MWLTYIKTDNISEFSSICTTGNRALRPVRSDVPLVEYAAVLEAEFALLLPDGWLTATDLARLVFVFDDFVIHATL